MQNNHLVANNRGKLVLVRHGQTAWARDGLFTGRTDIPLTEVGRSQAVEAKKLLEGYTFWETNGDDVFVSPLRRAVETASLIGFQNVHINPNLPEWDYGPIEGHSRKELEQIIGHEFSLWEDGVHIDTSSLSPAIPLIDENGVEIPVATMPGESLASISTRARLFVKSIEDRILEGKDVAVVAHSHILRTIACVWIGVDPKFASGLFLDTASVSVLGYLQKYRCIVKWNQIGYQN